MRILMLSWEYPPHMVGGLGKHVAELVPSLLKLGIEVDLVTPGWAGGDLIEEVVPGFTVYRTATAAGDQSDFLVTAQQTNGMITATGRELLEARPYDLIHCHDWLVAFAAIELKHAFKVPLLATIHATEYGRNHGNISSDLQRAIHNIEWWLTYEAWRVIACTEFMREEIVTALRAPFEKIDIIPNGVVTDRFDELDQEDLTGFRRRWAGPHEQIVFNVGRVVFEKGVQTIVEAAPLVLERRPDTVFIIAGSGGYLDHVRARAAELGLLHRITFAGRISDGDRDRLFKVADVAVFPSLYEPFGIVALEAMAARLPVVTSDVGGFKEVVDLHETGLKVYPNDPASLAWGILHTLEHLDWTYARVENAYRAAKTRFSWDRIAAQTRDVYVRIVEARKTVDW